MSWSMRSRPPGAHPPQEFDVLKASFFSLDSVAFSAGFGYGRSVAASGRTSAAAVDRGAEIDVGQPEVALGIEGKDVRVDLRPGVGEELERVGDHAVVGQERLGLDLC